jgi:hypothetical protein
MEYEFKQALTRSGNIVTPDKIIITDDSVTWEKRKDYLIGKDSKTIPIDEVSSVELEYTGWGTNITIYSRGSGSIHAKSFTKSDAKEIKRLIEELKHKGSSNLSNNKYNETEDDFGDDVDKIFLKEIEEEERKKKEDERKNYEEYEKISKYLEPNKIPLLSFGKTSNEIIDELNKILSFYYKLPYNVNIKDKSNLISCYTLKINEGIRKLEGFLKENANLKNDIEYFKNEQIKVLNLIDINEKKIDINEKMIKDKRAPLKTHNLIFV